MVGGILVFYYFLKKKAKTLQIGQNKVTPTIRQTDIDVIEEVDEESSSGIEITVGKEFNR